jgi:hypothetical protein
MSPQRSTLSRIGSDYTAPVDIRAQRQYKSGMYRPEDNAYIQNYAKQDNLKHLFYTEYINVNSSNSPTGMFIRPNDSQLFLTSAWDGPVTDFISTSNEIEAFTLSDGSIKSLTSSIKRRTVMQQRNDLGGSNDYSTFYMSPSGISFKPDGTRMIFCGNLIRQTLSGYYQYFGPVIFQYNLNIPWSLSASSIDNNPTFTWDVLGNPFGYQLETTFPSTLMLAPDKTYALDGQSVKVVADNSFEQTLPNPKIRDMFVKPDGTRLYYLRGNATTDTLYQCDISPSNAWDIGANGVNLSAPATNIFRNDVTNNNFFVSISFSSDGYTLYLLGGNFGGNIYIYNLSTPWDITTATNLNEPYSYVGQYRTLGYSNSSTQNASLYLGGGMAFLNNGESLITSSKNNYSILTGANRTRFFQFDTLAF